MQAKIDPTLGEQRVVCRPEYLEDEHGFKVRPEQELPFDRSDKQLYPVSVTWQPPFTMMVDLIGAGDLQVVFHLQSPNPHPTWLRLCVSHWTCMAKPTCRQEPPSEWLTAATPSQHHRAATTHDSPRTMSFGTDDFDLCKPAYQHTALVYVTPWREGR